MLPAAIHPDDLLAATHWARALRPAADAEFQMLPENKISPGSWWASNHLISTYFLMELAERYAPGLIPNHSVLRVSAAGQAVARHRDVKPLTPRQAVMVTIYQSFGAPWPITIKAPRRAAVTHLPMPGEAVLFEGPNDWHWRPPLHADRVVNAILYYRDPDDEHPYGLRREVSELRVMADYAALKLRRMGAH